MAKTITAMRCVWVTNNWTKWASEHGQIIKSGLSENYGGETILTTAKNGYFLNRFEGYREMSD